MLDRILPKSLSLSFPLSLSRARSLISLCLSVCRLKHAGHRVLIFSQMTALMDILEDYFDLRQFKYLRLDGSTTVDDRAEKMRLFQEPGSE